MDLKEHYELNESRDELDWASFKVCLLGIFGFPICIIVSLCIMLLNIYLGVIFLILLPIGNFYLLYHAIEAHENKSNQWFSTLCKHVRRR